MAGNENLEKSTNLSQNKKITDGGIGVSNLEKDISKSIKSENLDIYGKSEAEPDPYYQKEISAENYIQDMKMIKGDEIISAETKTSK